MSLRDTLNNNPAVVTGGAVVVLLLCLLLVYFRMGGGGGANITMKITYFDVANNKLRLVEWNSGPYPDSPAEGMPETYEAYLFACDECPTDSSEIFDGMTLQQIKESGMYIGWIVRREPGSLAEVSENTTAEARTLDNDKWYKATSPQWAEIESKIRRQCPQGGEAAPCYAP